MIESCGSSVSKRSSISASSLASSSLDALWTALTEFSAHGHMESTYHSHLLDFLETGGGVSSSSPASLSEFAITTAIDFLGALSILISESEYQPRAWLTYAARFGIVLEGATETGGVPCSVESSLSSSEEFDNRCLLYIHVKT